MQLNQLKPRIKKRRKKRIGRGGKGGTYSGRGMKGQKARAGRRIRPQLRDVIKKLPKKRGYRFKTIIPKPLVVNLGLLEKNFSDNDKINPKILFEKKLIRKHKGKFPRVKILGDGKLTKKLFISDCIISGAAKTKIEKVGGKYE
ncbi:MAG: uL15 family ribosomal protein [Patescibacteria group bacterium]